MTNDSFFRTVDVSSSALKAMKARMDTIAQNIANAHVTRGDGGEPYRRRSVVFETVMERDYPSG
ncbi:MAG: flagellar basal body protein, partial [Planctomycetes bacterium]|nr:flagellar basal body protein [Planctomycetota bacterium]